MKWKRGEKTDGHTENTCEGSVWDRLTGYSQDTAARQSTWWIPCSSWRKKKNKINPKHTRKSAQLEKYGWRRHGSAAGTASALSSWNESPPAIIMIRRMELNSGVRAPINSHLRERVILMKRRLQAWWMMCAEKEKWSLELVIVHIYFPCRVLSEWE